MNRDPIGWQANTPRQSLPGRDPVASLIGVAPTRSSDHAPGLPRPAFSLRPTIDLPAMLAIMGGYFELPPE
jgi:hypothetical protein